MALVDSAASVSASAGAFKLVWRGTAAPRMRAGRASSVSSQRFRCGNSSMPTPAQLWIRAQLQLAMSAME